LTKISKNQKIGKVLAALKKFILILSIWEIMSCKINQPESFFYAFDLLKENPEQCASFIKDFRFSADSNRLTKNYSPTTNLSSATEEILIQLPYGSVTRAIPSYEIEGEGSVFVNGVSQENGVSILDFTESKTFELISNHNQTCRKTLQVSVQPISPVVDTGVKECYDQSAVLPTTPSCSGDDSLRQDGVWTDVPNARAWSPAEQITTNAGIVRDRLTGLIWRKCPRGQASADSCFGTAHLNSYEDAERYCSVELNSFDDGKGYGGFKNWRLPTVHELSSIINRSLPHTSGLVDSDIFPNSPGDLSTTDGYWTINEDASNSNSNYAWRIHFEYNSSNSLYNHIQTRIKSGLRRVRCVSSNLPPNKSMENIGNGIIRDHLTKLDWDQCVFDQTFGSNLCSGSGTVSIWTEALEACLKKGTGWRLPNINELMSLYDFNRNNPGVDTNLFNGQPTASTAYWSSTTNPAKIDEAFFQEFNGFVDVRSKVAQFLVRCVRTSVD
jgi:hypothetical protein